MNNLMLNKIISAKKKLNVYFVGICGVSISQLALALKQMGHNVCGSDLQTNEIYKKLVKSGIKVHSTHSAKNIKNVDALIYSFAVQNGEEVKFAQKHNIPCFSRAELLGAFLKKYKTSICVAGAHGKTTTTALIYSILKMANKNVSLHLGGEINCKANNNNQINNFANNIAVCEACEYKDAFLSLKPTIAVINNVAPEHLDYFKNYDNVKKSFTQFGKSAQMLICNDLQFLQNKNKIIFGKNGIFTAKNVKINKNGTYNFDCYKNNEFYYSFKINLIGKHNVHNALASICVADYLQINKKTIHKALGEFCGVKRRFEFLHKKRFIVHDYAHHPDEISAVINETLKFYKQKLLVVFQPHTYSRTKNLMNEFIKCFNSLHEVVIYKTYSAREQYLKSGSANTLAKKIGSNAVYFKNKQKLTGFVLNKICDGYGILFLGAGNINDIAKNISKLC